MDVVLDRTHSESLDSFDAQARPPRLAWPRLYDQKTTFPKISERRLWTLLGAGPGELGARGSRIHSARDTQPPEPIAALSRCASMALSVPSDRNRSPRGARAGLLLWWERLGRGGGGARAVGWDPPGYRRSVGAIGEPRSARPMDTSSTSQGVAAVAGEAMERGAMDRHAGVSSGFVHPERRCDTL